MAAESFNSQGGYTVDIPPRPVIDANGNVVSNVFTSGNVTAQYVYANNYLYANGQPLTVSAAGSNTQVQFNNNGNFAASANFTFNSSLNLLTVANLQVNTTANLGNVANVKIFGGVNGYVLQTDGLGNLAWTAQTGGGGNGSPGGANSQLQWNNSGSFGASPTLTFDGTSNTLNAQIVAAQTFVGNLTGIASNATVAQTVSNAAQPNITSLGTLTGLTVNAASANLGNAVIANYFVGSGINLTNIPGPNIIGSVPLAAAVTNNAQPNITSLGTLSNLSVNGNIEATGNINGGNLSASNLITADRLWINTNANFTGNLNGSGNVNFTQSGNVNLGNLVNIHIGGGLNGYVLSTDGLGNLEWIDNGNGGGGGPSGSNTQIQYNDSGVFGGSPFFTFNEVTNTVTIAGNLVANVLAMGSGINRFFTQQVFIVTTSTSSKQAIVSLQANSVSGADFVIVSTDPAGNKRQINKFTVVLIGGELSYNETSTLEVNGFTGDYTIEYVSGNIIVPDQVVLYFEPLQANVITTKVMVTAYDP
jgi:hypothetical protein